MAATKKSHQVFVDHFRGQTRFTKQDISGFFLLQGKKLNDAALRWRIYDLKNAGLLESVETGVYTISKKPYFIPVADNFMIGAVALFNQNYYGLGYCVWKTDVLHSLMTHQPVNSIYVFETDRDISESVFHHFKANGLNAFNNPPLQIMDDYVFGSQDAIVIKPLVSRAPLLTTETLIFPSLEKILVDIFCDRHQFYVFGGQEMIVIFENAFHLYKINMSSLYAYADRRGKKKLLMEFIGESVLDNQLEE